MINDGPLQYPGHSFVVFKALDGKVPQLKQSKPIQFVKKTKIIDLKSKLIRLLRLQKKEVPNGIRLYNSLRDELEGKDFLVDVEVRDTVDKLVYIFYNNREIMQPIVPFKKQQTLKARKEYRKKLREQWPDRIPVIIESANRPLLPDLLDSSWQHKNKYLIPKDRTTQFVMDLIRKSLISQGKFNQEDSIFMFDDNNSVIQPGKLLSTAEKEYKSDDGFLHVYYTTQDPFGS